MRPYTQNQERLIELLNALPGGSRVIVNRVGNLLIATPDGASNFAYLDFVADGEIELLIKS